MPKIILPPPTPTEIRTRDHQETLLETGLNGCWRGDQFDAERAEKLLRAYAIEIFTTICAFYRNKIGFQSEWLPEIVNESVLRALTVYGHHRRHGLSQVGEMLKETVMEHLRTTSTSERSWSEFYQAFPASRQLFDPNPNDPPLLKQVKDHARQKLNLTPKSEPVPSEPVPIAGTLIERRAALLSEYQRATATNDYQIYTAQNRPIHKPEFYQWKNGKLPEKSKTVKNFEAFLKAKKRLIRKNPTS